MPNAAPVLYLSDMTADRFDPADLFDIAFLLRSGDSYRVLAVATPDGTGERALDALAVRAGAGNVRSIHDSTALAALLRAADEPVNLVAAGWFAPLADLLETDRALLREKVARLFVMGGHVNDYSAGRAGERVPLDPRLRERHPERFVASGDPRLVAEGERQAFARLLSSGEGVIWLPRDICLWRYAAPFLLVDGGPASDFLLRELFYANLSRTPDRFAAGDAPVLLSSLPALLLAREPDPTLWLRWFRAVPARVAVDLETGDVTQFEPKDPRANLYAVVGIDGGALGALLTKTLRVRPPVNVR